MEDLRYEIGMKLLEKCLECGFDTISYNMTDNTYCLDTKDDDGMMSTMFDINVFGNGYVDYVVGVCKNPSLENLANLKKFIDENIGFLRENHDVIFGK